MQKISQNTATKTWKSWKFTVKEYCVLKNNLVYSNTNCTPFSKQIYYHHDLKAL